MQKKNLFGILILIAYFASCNQIHKTHYENGWYHSKKTVLLKSLL